MKSTNLIQNLSAFAPKPTLAALAFAWCSPWSRLCRPGRTPIPASPRPSPRLSARLTGNGLRLVAMGFEHPRRPQPTHGRDRRLCR
jgi:hypothetical protein